jgi:2-amino-4-hydroxy-6-hydroxymethyldihydropteridine diphosphokinase
MELSYLILGGNIGDRLDYLHQGVELLSRDAGRITAKSSIYESEPWGFDDPHWFLNRVVAVETDLAPLTLLDCIQKIELTLNRTRIDNVRYAARTIDIDILFYGNHAINLPELIIPHPKIADRMFVLQPMTELAPDFIHPVLHRTMASLKEHCTDTKQLRMTNHE